jgi:opacity protein-like surface antigen
MHRFLGRFVVGAGALLIAATAQAQGTSSATSGRPFKIGGALGATIPIGDFSDVAELGWHLGGLIEYKPQSLPLTWRGEITYHRNGLEDGAFVGFPNAGGHASILGFVANALFPFGDAASTARPYAIAGLGLYHASRSGDLPGGNTISNSDTDFGLNLGGGFIFNLSGFETFVELRYHTVFTEDNNTSFIPISFGFKF